MAFHPRKQPLNDSGPLRHILTFVQGAINKLIQMIENKQD